MASKDGERRMLFDIRGRRKNVVKVVYAVLALLMGLSLFLVIGPAPISDLFGTGSSSSSAEPLEDQAERIERKLKKDPEDPALLLSLTRAQINVGNALADVGPAGEVAFTPESRQQLAEASETWSKYLKAADEPNAGGAQVVAQALYGLAATSSTVNEAKTNIQAAARAQQIVAESRPNLGSLSTLAIYRYLSFDYKGAEQARREAAAYANTQTEREGLAKELDQYDKRGHEFQKQVTEIEKEAQKSREEGQAPLVNPLNERNPLGG